jgi:hypothetical protein
LALEKRLSNCAGFHAILFPDSGGNFIDTVPGDTPGGIGMAGVVLPYAVFA